MCLSSSESLLSVSAVLMHLPVAEHRAVAANNILLHLIGAGTARRCQLQHFPPLASHDLWGVHCCQTAEQLQSIDALQNMAVSEI